VVQAVNDLGVTGSGALVSAFLLSLSFIPYLSFINAPGLLLNAFGFFAGRNRNRSWGFIVDHVTGKPISFATCRVYLQGASGFVTQTVSDAEGRYGFVLNPGKYRLEVIHSGYAKFTGDIKIEEDESTYVYDVSLRPKGLASEEIRRRYNVLSDLVLNLKKAWAYLRPLLFAFGILLSVLSILVKPVLLNWIIFAAYIIIIGLFLYRKLSKRSSHASVVDAETGLRVPGAIVKIFDPKKWEVIDTQITNSNGMFDYWGEPGNYAILVTARGYRFPSASQTGVNYTKYGKAKLMKARLKKGRNALQIYVDPTERVERGDQTEESGYNDASPFSE
jgi:hypothetical protein